MTNIETQKQSIADYILLGLPLTPKDAMDKFGCTKISTRIGELERENRIPTVKREMIEVETRFGKTRVMKYQLPRP